eukprot:2053713-Alexandrium_andersonii.AAC.1
MAESSESFGSQLVDPPNGRPGEPPQSGEQGSKWRVERKLINREEGRKCRAHKRGRRSLQAIS